MRRRTEPGRASLCCCTFPRANGPPHTQPGLKARASSRQNTKGFPNSGRHVIGGWLVQDVPAMGGHFVQMQGSNTMWMAVMWILPEKNLAIVVTTSSGAANASETCDKVVARLLQESGK